VAIAAQKPPEGNTGEHVPKTLDWKPTNDSAQMCNKELLSQTTTRAECHSEQQLEIQSVQVSFACVYEVCRIGTC
jgi:hypothetical protein